MREIRIIEMTKPKDARVLPRTLRAPSTLLSLVAILIATLFAAGCGGGSGGSGVAAPPPPPIEGEWFGEVTYNDDWTSYFVAEIEAGEEDALRGFVTFVEQSEEATFSASGTTYDENEFRWEMDNGAVLDGTLEDDNGALSGRMNDDGDMYEFSAERVEETADIAGTWEGTTSGGGEAKSEFVLDLESAGEDGVHAGDLKRRTFQPDDKGGTYVQDQNVEARVSGDYLRVVFPDNGLVLYQAGIDGDSMSGFTYESQELKAERVGE